MCRVKLLNLWSFRPLGNGLRNFRNDDVDGILRRISFQSVSHTPTRPRLMN